MFDTKQGRGCERTFNKSKPDPKNIRLKVKWTWTLAIGYGTFKAIGRMFIPKYIKSNNGLDKQHPFHDGNSPKSSTCNEVAHKVDLSFPSWHCCVNLNT